ncbi:MAG: 4Fe-4S binding protein [Desulfuromonadaceae bacterium]|nr:4Fe-4S binding protein [Desulfuromonadaceae bacterium]
MTDSETVTGNMDDLLVDSSRCLRMRYSESGCRRCQDICPHRSVKLENGLTINPEHCCGCLLCTAVCPVGALEQNNDYSVCVAQLSRVPEPVLGCNRTKECSNGILACLGGLSEEHLVTLSKSLSGKLTLNMSRCSGCPNSAMLPYLRQRLALLLGAGLLDGGCSIFMAESAQDINYHDESVGRRSFFKSFRTSLFQSAVVILSGSNQQAERRTEYAGKRLPLRRELLNNTRNNSSQEFVSRMQKHFDYSVSFAETCTGCQGCVAICPTGALQAESSDTIPNFIQELCTGCGLCSEFCLDGALRIYTVE